VARDTAECLRFAAAGRRGLRVLAYRPPGVRQRREACPPHQNLKLNINYK
jgi:hypothetical protein